MFPPYDSPMAVDPYVTLIHAELQEQSYAYRGDDDLMYQSGFHSMNALLFRLQPYRRMLAITSLGSRIMRITLAWYRLAMRSVEHTAIGSLTRT